MTSADSLNARGAEFYLQGDFNAAKVHFDAALLVDPNCFPALMNLLSLLGSRNRLGAAAIVSARALALAPNHGKLWSNYGNILFRLERYPEARAALHNAQVLSSGDVGTWHNSLLLAIRERDFDEAYKAYQRIIELGGDSPTIQNDIAHVYLAAGRLDEAFMAYESRWHSLMHLEPWDLHLPEWQGEDLNGKRLLLHHEQGYGDTIMTARFVPNLLDKGAKITFAVSPALIELFNHQNWNIELQSIHTVKESQADQFDFHSPLYSAMRWLGVQVSDIKPEPYLVVPDLVVPGVDQHSKALNVGICWASGARGTQMDWRRRTSPLEDWLILGELPNIRLWSLFPGVEAQNDIIRVGAEGLVIDKITGFKNFAETAAFVSQLDLVISVDTAVVHLAGAMGTPTWMLNQFTPCWRWWDQDAESGRPWYDSVRIFPQKKRGDWRSQLEACVEELKLFQVQSKKIAA